MCKMVYNTIDKYSIRAVCDGPMHIGGMGEQSEVLIHPADNVPFIQASGICGALRAYCSGVAEKSEVDKLFEGSLQENGSRLKVTDGLLELKTIRMELRPRLRLDSVSGTVAASEVKGNEKKSGNKFDMQYIGIGTVFSFDLYIYNGTQREKLLIEKSLAAMNNHEIQLGGQKSNGCGYVNVSEVLHKQYDMTSDQDRTLWLDEGGMERMKLPELKSEDYQNAYRILVSAETEGEILVKGITIADFGKNAPKAENIRNAKNCYIIPGSSVKGAVRNRMEMIANYMNLDADLIYDAFGKNADINEEGMAGNLLFQDVVIGDVDKEESIVRCRIHIDRFTGGVMNGGLFSERNVYGKMEITIDVRNRRNSDAVVGLLLLALRDLSYKLYALGGGQNIGKGYINVNTIQISDLRGERACSFDKKFQLSGDEELLQQCMDALKQLQAA